MIGAGLSSADGQGGRVPLLATSIPSLDNGLWQLNTDGTMVTTFNLRPSAEWHDGTPITADDFLFALRVGRERRVPAFGSAAYAAITDAHAPDPHTLVVAWQEPYNAADAIFDWAQSYGPPLPEHLLANDYETSPDRFLDLPYWNQDYVGSGPFKVVSWDPGVGMQLAAHDGFALGRPKIDRVDLQVISDPNTLGANLLTGTVDAAVTVGSADAAKQLSDQWQTGTVIVDLGSGTFTSIVPQFIDPSPTVISDLRFRTALAIGIDREAIVTQIDLGYSPVPLSFLMPGQPRYAALEATLPRYDYDPQRAAQLLTDLGYAKGGNGMLRDATGQPLAIEVRSAPTGNPQQNIRAATVIGDDWQQLGVDTQLVAVPSARASDTQYIATFPGYYVAPRTGDVPGLHDFTSTHTPMASNNYAATSPPNYGRYTTPELDALITTYFRTIPLDQRAEVMGRIVHATVDTLAFLGLWYTTGFGARGNRLTGPGPAWVGPSFGWNAYTWDLVS